MKKESSVFEEPLSIINILEGAVVISDVKSFFSIKWNYILLRYEILNINQTGSK